MQRKRLLWQIFPSYLLITLLALLAITWYASTSLRKFFYSQTEQDLLARAKLVIELTQNLNPQEDRQEVESICREMSKLSKTQILFILRNGTVLGDNTDSADAEENILIRPEVQKALNGAQGLSTRFNTILRKKMMFLAIPYKQGPIIVGVVRTSIPISPIDKALAEVYLQITLAGIIIALISAVVSLIVSRRISRPLEEMKKVSVEFANGNLHRRLPILNSEEIGGLAEAMNQMAYQLDDRIKTVVRQQKEQEAILSSMVEGVLAVDREEKIISVNHAFIHLFNIHADACEGRNLQEVVRNKDLHQFVDRTLAHSEPVEGDIVIRDGGGRFLQAHGTALTSPTGEKMGAVVAINDVTRIRRLENIRREFVANVSHELKTPITAIKGFVETLQDGAVRDINDAEKFLGIIAKHVDRLNAIIEDLLSLSRIEQNKDEGKIHLEKVPIRRVIESAREVCEPKAQAKNIQFFVMCEENVVSAVNAPLLEQALVNLIDNAIKYSEMGCSVQIEAEDSSESIVLSVHDRGCGMEEKYVSRIFERFYRIDKARSRKLGGTGLGLAIVKHIAQAHGGSVAVSSKVGEGSSFSIHLPKQG